MSNSKNRRQFLGNSARVAAAGIAMPYFFSGAPKPAFATGSKNDRISVGLIGAGGMGSGNIESIKDLVDVVAIADVDKRHLAKANAKFSEGKADVYEDYRAMLDRDDIDVLHIATPDHWHTKPLVEAMYAGRDVYCEKPLTLTIDEGKLIRKVQEETGRIVQVGTQQRSTFKLFVKAMAMVADGRLGKIKNLQASIGGAPSSDEIPVADVPEELNWDRWLGPVPAVDYRLLKRKKGRPQTNGHYEFRWWYEYSGGKLTDWGAHHVDIATWALAAAGQDDTPLSIEGTAEHPVEFVDGVPTQNDRYNTATAFNFKVAFPGDVSMTIRNDESNGVLIEGEKGRIFVNRGKLTGAPVEELKENPLPEDAIRKVYKDFEPIDNERRAHWINFFTAVDEQRDPISDVHTHMKMLNVCHLAGICARTGRKLMWDAETETITGDEAANAMLGRPYRAGYEIEMPEMAATG